MCPRHKRIQHPSGKISLLLDVPARMYSSCKSKLFVGCFILLSSKKKKKRASARPHAAIAEQLLVLIARLKLVYIFLQCTTLSRTGKSCISFLLTMSWFLSHIPWDNLLYEHTELLQENLYGNDTTCQNVQFNNPYNGYPKKHNDAWENTFSKAFYHKVHCSSKLSGTVRVKFLTRHLLNV